MYNTSYLHNQSLISRFIVLSINFRHADVSTRSIFSLSSDSCHKMLNEAKQAGLKSMVVINTCNRTEVYAYWHDKEYIISLFLKHAGVVKNLFDNTVCIKTGTEAIDHLYSVASGLDSQIIGDAEIAGQLKEAVQQSRTCGMLGPLMDRTMNYALQASKLVKSATRISTGTTSVSYAAVEWLRDLKIQSAEKIVLIGAGQFGSTVAKNIRYYFPSAQLTIINRTDHKARMLAEALSAEYAPYKQIHAEISQADIIILCLSATEYIVMPSHLNKHKEQCLLDLSVPGSIHPDIKKMKRVVTTDIDEISRRMAQTMEKRKQDIPKAKLILQEVRNEFLHWLLMQKHVPVIQAAKEKLSYLGETHFCSSHDKTLLQKKVNKAIGTLAMKFRYAPEKGCHYIHMINDFLKQDTVA